MNSHIGRGLASIAVCALGIFAIYQTGGISGLAGVVVGLWIIWAQS